MNLVRSCRCTEMPPNKNLIYILIIVPVPKITAPKSLTDCLPVALTSLVMKVFEFVKNEILGVTLDNMEPLWCANRTRTGVEDAVCTLCHTVQSHLDGVKNFPWLLFMIFPLLFVLYVECQSHYEVKHIIKFADDSVFVCLLSNDDLDQGPAVDYFIN